MSKKIIFGIVVSVLLVSLLVSVSAVQLAQ